MSDQREREVGRADHNLAGARGARDPNRSGKELEFADDRGGSRDGEREDGEAGDREQLDERVRE